MPPDGMGNSYENPLWGGAEGAAFGVGPARLEQPTPAPLLWRGI
jgi:hypothetical protein